MCLSLACVSLADAGLALLTLKPSLGSKGARGAASTR